MYGSVTKPSDFEEYVSLHQLESIDEPEKSDYCTNAWKIAGCVLLTIYGFIYYIVFYVI